MSTVFIPNWRPAAEFKCHMLERLVRADFVIEEIRRDMGLQYIWTVYREKDGKLIASGPDCFDVMADACQFLDAQDALSGQTNRRGTQPKVTAEEFRRKMAYDYAVKIREEMNRMSFSNRTKKPKDL